MRVKDLIVGKEYAIVSGWKWSQKSNETLARRFPDEVYRFTVTRIEKHQPAYSSGDTKQVVATVYGKIGDRISESDIQPFQIRMRWDDWLAILGPERQRKEELHKKQEEEAKLKKALEQQALDEVRRFFPADAVRFAHVGYGHVESGVLYFPKDQLQNLVEMLEEAWTVRKAKRLVEEDTSEVGEEAWQRVTGQMVVAIAKETKEN